MRVARTLALWTILLACAGCIQAERVITVNLDGSGSIVDTMAVTGQLAAVQAAIKMQPKPEQVAAKTRRVKAAAVAMGVKLDSYQPQSAGQPEVVRYSFADVTKVKADGMPFMANDDEESAVSPTSMSFRFHRAGGRSVLTVITPSDPSARKRTPAEIDEEVANMKARADQVAGAHLLTKLELGGPVATTNAPMVDGRTITLLSIDVATLVGDEPSLRKVLAVEDPMRADPKVLAGIKGLKFNLLPELKVEFGSR
jgi:hypothetical protein